MTTRRDFIGAAAAGAASFPFGAFAAKSASSNLTFGVLSDTRFGENYQDAPRRLEEVLRFFRQKDVDAVAFLGDITQTGRIVELEAFADVWSRVFPGGRGKGGSKVELLIVTGDHDAAKSQSKWKNMPKEKAEAEFFAYGDNPKKIWKRLFNQEWEPVWKRDVKDYSFIGAQDALFKPKVDEFMAKTGPTLSHDKPFFFLNHMFPAKIGCGLSHLGTGDKVLSKALSPFPNAVSLTGHSHLALTDEHAVWQGAFTSICAGSFYASSAEYSRENVSVGWHQTYRSHVMKIDDGVVGQGGALLVQVSDAQIKAQRLHVPSACKQSLGPVWKLSVPAQPGGAYDYERRKSARRAPQFAAGARLGVEFCPNGHPELGPSYKGKPCYCVTIPCAKTVKAPRSGEVCRVFDYVVTAKTAGKDPVVLTVMSPGATKPESMANADGICLVPASRLAEGQQIRFTVVPRECFGLEGKPITKIFLPQTGADTAKK
ncbi:MAG: metallophosphoesterase [Kiritimatiellae bacterium]|nr:metallophosphoesterase [Kiritimatiellia bacterium]